MIDHTEVYDKKAEQYELLISREDYESNILKVLNEIRTYEGTDIIDLGAGTGRLTCLLAPFVNSIIACDEAEPMLKVTAEKLNRLGLNNWRTLVADHRDIPVEDNIADVITAGWTICYLGSTNNSSWEENLDYVIAEMKRIIRPGGTIIIFETLGTGYEHPNGPDFLQRYYAKLVEDFGFTHKYIRTDYKFETNEEAEELTRFFFGKELADEVVDQKLTILPECTGVWWLHL